MVGITVTTVFATNMNVAYYTVSANAFIGAQVFMTGIFVVLGFGLTLAYFG